MPPEVAREMLNKQIQMARPEEWCQALQIM